MSATSVIVILIVISIVFYIPNARDYLMESEKNRGWRYRYIVHAIDCLLNFPCFFLFGFACLKWIGGRFGTGEHTAVLLAEASSLWNWSGVLFVTSLCLRLWFLPVYFPDDDEDM